MIDLAAIEARCNAAMTGPWEIKTNVHRETSGQAWGWIDGPSNNWCWSDRYSKDRANAEFTAHAREDIPALIARVRELEGEVIEWKERHLQAALNWQQDNQENANCMEARAIAFEAELSKSHARERAAVADLTEILSKNELNICTFCKRYHKDCGCYMDDDTCDAVWRGPQEDELC